MSRSIHITETDLDRLMDLLQSGTAGSQRDNRNLKEHQEELDRAVVVDPQSIPRDVVTMNSRAVLLDLDTQEQATYTLVFPSQADIGQNKISVLAPIGMAMLGYREGDSFDWKTPSGLRRLKIVKVLYQPEAEGDFHL